MTYVRPELQAVYDCPECGDENREKLTRRLDGTWLIASPVFCRSCGMRWPVKASDQSLQVNLSKEVKP